LIRNSADLAIQHRPLIRVLAQSVHEVPVTKSIYIPFPKNRYFVGRTDELDILKQRLMVNQDCQKISIVGLGGTGKTQVALQFAYTVKETWRDYSVFWLPALSLESFEQACADIAKALHIPKTAGDEENTKEQVREWLSAGRAGKWLLVIDNADDPDIVFGTRGVKGIIDYLPESEEGVTVYTTRSQEMAVSLTRADMIEVGPMNRPDATKFLQKSLIRKKLLRADAATTELLDALAYLPLAIAQAAAYLNMNKMSVAKYLRLLHNTEQDIVNLMKKEFYDNARYKGSANAVATTWVVSFRQIRERDAAAADLLAFLSCVEWKSIPHSLMPRVQPEERMEQAIGTLCGYCFLSLRDYDVKEDEEGKEGKEEWYDMHRLVHLATRIWISQYGDPKEMAEKAVRRIAAIFPHSKYANRAVWRGYLPHALRLLENLQGSSSDMKAKLCLRVGRCLLVDGRIRDAVKWLEESCWCREGLDERDSDRLASEHELARAYEADGQVKKAVALLEHVMAVQEQVLEVEHPDRLVSQHELARAYEADGQVKKAVALLEHVVAVREQVLEEEHPDRLESQHELAGAYQADGQVKKAVALLEHVVAVREQVLEEEHPGRLASQHELARAYEADGQVKKAVALLEHVVAVQEQLLEVEHPSRLVSQHALAVAYETDGQVKKAVALLEHVVAVREQVLEEEHPDRLASQHELARAYEADGQVKKAVALLEHVVAVQERTLRNDHPSRIISVQALAKLHAKLKNA
jgi:tetratricopeptide (TPR) repeat protein